MDLKKFCGYFYRVSHIPIHIFNNDELQHTFPEEQIINLPDSTLLVKIKKQTNTISYSILGNDYYGIIIPEGSSSFILTGPFSFTGLHSSQSYSSIFYTNKCNYDLENEQDLFDILRFIYFSINNKDVIISQSHFIDANFFLNCLC